MNNNSGKPNIEHKSLNKKKENKQAKRSYIAFISYRHLPLDSEVAKKVQRHIEHYTIPKERRNATGKKHFGMVFRDEDELPTSPNLSDNIKEALDHSRYLIVICTPETSKSLWCTAEIEYFIKRHGRQRIIAVLADGTPKESFPSALVHIKDDDGTIIRHVEPLAANVIGKIHMSAYLAFLKEMVRIYAAFLECPFDALWHREKRYIITKAVQIVVLASLILAIYIAMILKNSQITHDNLMLSYTNSGFEKSLSGSADEGMSYYLRVLREEPRNETAKMGALVELQSHKWIFADGEVTEPQAPVKEPVSTMDGNMIKVTVEDGTVYILEIPSEIDPELVESQYDDFSDYKHPVAILDNKNDISFLVYYGGYLYKYREGPDWSIKNHCILSSKLNVAEILRGEYDSYGIERFGDIVLSPSQDRAVLRTGAAAALIDVQSWEILNGYDDDAFYDNLQIIFSPRERFFVAINLDPGTETFYAPVLKVWDDIGTAASASTDREVKGNHVNAFFLDNDFTVLWGKTNTIDIYDSLYDCDLASPIKFKTPLKTCQKRKDGIIEVGFEDDSVYRFRIADFSANIPEPDPKKRNTSVSSLYNVDTQQTLLADQKEGLYFALSGDHTTLLLLDEDKNTLDSFEIEYPGGYIDSSWFYEVLVESFCTDPSTNTAYILIDDKIMRVGIENDHKHLSAPKWIRPKEALQEGISSVAAFSKGYAVATNKERVYLYKNDEEQSFTHIDTQNHGLISQLAVSNQGVLAAYIEVEHDIIQAELWEYEKNRHIATIKDLDLSDCNISFDDPGNLLLWGNEDGSLSLKKQYLLYAPDPDKETINTLFNLTSCDLNKDLRPIAKDTSFEGFKGNWGALFTASYPYEKQD